jgi:predicted permease
MGTLGQDLAYGARGLARRPGFTLVALLALGVTIGLNTSVFTVYSAVALRSWHVRDPGQVVRVFRVPRKGPTGFSIAQYRFLAEQTRAFAGLAALSWYESDQLAGGRVKAQYVSGNYFRVLGVGFEAGRGFDGEDDDPARPRAVAVITHEAWQRFFGGDPAIIGRAVVLRHATFTIVGVAARGFTGTALEPRDLFVPLAARRLVRAGESGATRFLTDPDVCCSDVAGRLAAGVSWEDARGELERLSREFRVARGGEGEPIRLTDTAVLSAPQMGWLSSALGLMFTAVFLVLLLACANVGNLLLAQAAARRHEIAVRLALGATRARIVRQLLTEGLLLAGAAGGVGVGLAYVLPAAAVGTMFSVAPDTLASFHLQPDVGVLAFTVAIAVLACFTFGLAPAFHSARGGTLALRSRNGAGAAGARLRGALLATQVAVSLVLLAAAGLLVRGIAHARAFDLGFAADGVSLLTFSVPARYDGAHARPLLDRLERELAALPRSPRFAFTSRYPLEDDHVSTSFQRAGQSERRSVRYEEVSAGYFDVLKIPIVRGRGFTAADASEPVIVVNETLARRYWPAEDAIGASVVLDRDAPQTVRVIGVAKDARTDSVAEVAPAFYRPWGYVRPDLYEEPFPYVLLEHKDDRTVATAAALAPRLDPDATVTAEGLARSVDRWFRPATVGAALAGIVGLLALALAALGMAGVFAYAVQQRTREIGIRMALGARTAHIVSLVLGAGARPLLIGLALGTAATVVAGRLLASRLFGLSPIDPVALAAVALVLAMAGLAATLVPARRAMRVEPTVALRYE